MPNPPGGPFWGGYPTDAGLFALALATLGLCILWLGVAAWRHRRNLRAVPVRIHVAGTRGKTATTRLIAAGLRAGGRRVLAKTTGAVPRLILPDGAEQPWPRRGPATVREQARFIAKAAAMGADAVVVECMAIRPEMIWASEDHLVRATAAVITNARPDHFEDLGEGPDAAADALRWAAPTGGRLYVTDEAASAPLAARAAARGAAVTVIPSDGLAPLAANRAMALAVCAAHGVPPELAGPAMDAAAADPGRFFTRRIEVGGKALRFASAFACNDPDSLALLWRGLNGGDGAAAPVVLLNARRDRPVRTRHFLDFLAAQAPRPLLFITGDPFAPRLARAAGLAPAAVRRLRARTPEAALAELADAAPAGGVVWGIGNFEGFGARMIAALEARGAEC